MTPDVTQFLSFVGGQCQKIKLETMVIVLPWNDPLQVAEKIAMLDCRSGGRTLLGIGRGLRRMGPRGGHGTQLHRRLLAFSVQALRNGRQPFRTNKGYEYY